jgi:hypothetical protein
MLKQVVHNYKVSMWSLLDMHLVLPLLLVVAAAVVAVWQRRW